MYQYKIKNSQLSGNITIPSSKSQTLRAILFASLSEGVSKIDQYLPSADVFQMIEACRLFGADIQVNQETLEIKGIGGKVNFTEDVIQAGNSGILLRFCSAIGALGHHPVVITGDHSIRHQRPMHTLLDGLSQLGAKAQSMRGDGFAPVIIKGPIKPGSTWISGEDSQPVSSLIIAAAFAEGPTEIHVKNPGEKPWVDMTLSWLDKLGIHYERSGYDYYKLFGNAHIKGFHYKVPGDFSSAAYPIAAALVTGSKITLRNIDMEDAQGDKKLIHVFQEMGAFIEIDQNHRSLYVKKNSVLHGLKIDINDFIDGITILSVVACFAEGDTLIYNGAVAKQKECNRIKSISTELKKMGAFIEEKEDGLYIKKSHLNGASLQSYNDHRMVMSLAVAALGAKGDSTISCTRCVDKTFPTFAKDFKRLGADISESAL